VRIYEAAKAHGLEALDAPVSGGDIGAKNATLTIMVGGDEEAFQSVKPLLEVMGKTVIRQGGPGAGQHTKMANQIAVAGSLLGAVEAVTYARSAGLDPRRMLLSIANGAAQSWQLSNNVPKMLDGNFDPGFYIKHFLKDLRIALDAAHAMKIELPMVALAERLFARLVAEGMGDLSTHAIYLLYERGLV
jgi:3-hydroxyisobutyrate dehydrogenase